MPFINSEEKRITNKYKDMLSRRPVTSSSRHQNDYMTDREYNVEKLRDPAEYQKALTLRNSFENSAAKIIRLRMESKDASAPVEKSINATTFQNTKSIRVEVNSFAAADFQLAFNSVAVDGIIDIRDIVGIVRSTMGEDVPLWIVNKFVSLGRDESNYKSLTWEQFSDIFTRVQDVVEYETSQGGLNIPSWIKSSGKSSTGLVGYKDKSSYMTDFSEELLLNYEDMKKNASKTASTRDLFLGTTKSTYQVPGYSGHIPANPNNTKKEEHSMGVKARPQPCYLRLVSERLGCVPKYSGYVPKSTGLNGERTTGMDPLTSTGSAYLSNI